jgi:hypothetical protein
MAKRKAGRPPALAAKLERGNLLLTKSDWRILRRAAKAEGVALAVKVRELVRSGMLQAGLIVHTAGNPPVHPAAPSVALEEGARKPRVDTTESAEPDTR